jgi:hypothetical protein
MTKKRIARISATGGLQMERGSGFNWDAGAVAFGDPLLIPAKKRRNRENTKARYKKHGRKKTDPNARLNMCINKPKV